MGRFDNFTTPEEETDSISQPLEDTSDHFSNFTPPSSEPSIEASPPRFFNPPGQDVFQPFESPGEAFDFGQAASDQITQRTKSESEGQSLDLRRRQDVEDLIFQYPLQQALIRQLDRSNLTLPAIQISVEAAEEERLKREQEAEEKKQERTQSDIESFTGRPTPKEDTDIFDQPGLSLGPREELAPFEQGPTLLGPTDEGQLPGLFDDMFPEESPDVDLGLRDEPEGYRNIEIASDLNIPSLDLHPDPGFFAGVSRPTEVVDGNDPWALRHPVASFIWDMTLGNISRAHQGMLAAVEQAQVAGGGEAVEDRILARNIAEGNDLPSEYIGPIAAFTKAMTGERKGPSYRDVMQNAGVKFGEDLDDDAAYKPWHSLTWLSQLGLEFAHAVGEFGSDPLVLLGGAGGRASQKATQRLVEQGKMRLFRANLQRGMTEKQALIEAENLVNGSLLYATSPALREIPMVVDDAGRVAHASVGEVKLLRTLAGRSKSARKALQKVNERFSASGEWGSKAHLDEIAKVTSAGKPKFSFPSRSKIRKFIDDTEDLILKGEGRYVKLPKPSQQVALRARQAQSAKPIVLESKPVFSKPKVPVKNVPSAGTSPARAVEEIGEIQFPAENTSPEVLFDAPAKPAPAQTNPTKIQQDRGVDARENPKAIAEIEKEIEKVRLQTEDLARRFTETGDQKIADEMIDASVRLSTLKEGLREAVKPKNAAVDKINEATPIPGEKGFKEPVKTEAKKAKPKTPPKEEPTPVGVSQPSRESQQISNAKKARKSQDPLPASGEPARAGVDMMPNVPLDPVGVPSEAKVQKDPAKVKQWRKSKKKISKAFGIPLRTGKFRQKALGIYKPDQQVVRTEVFDQVAVAAHEVGHHVEKIVPKSITKTSQYDSELLALGQRTSKPTYSVSKIRSEGRAEFFRIFVTNESAAMEAAPEFYRAFTQVVAKDEGLSKAIRVAQKEFGDILSQSPVEQIASSIAWGNRDRDITRIDEFIRDWKDEYVALQRSVEGLYEQGAPDILSNVYLMQRISRGSDGRAIEWLKNGIMDLDGNVISDVGLKDILKPYTGVTKSGKIIPKMTKRGNMLNHFQTYLKAYRIKTDLGPNGKTTPENFENAKVTVKEYEERFPEFVKSREDLKKFTDSLVEVSVREGVLTRGESEAILEANEAWVPFYRVFDDSVKASGAGVGKPFKRFSGTREEPTVPPLEGLLENVFGISRAVGRQGVMKALDSMANVKGAGLFVERLPSPPRRPSSFQLDAIKSSLEEYGVDLEGADLDAMLTVFNRTGRYGTDEPIFSYVVNGQRKYVRVKDRHMFEALNSSPDSVAELQVKLFKRMANVLRRTATLTPNFITRNPLRDTVESGILSKDGFIPVVDSLVGLIHMVGNTKTYRSWRNSGGSQATFVSQDRDLLAQELQKLGKSRLQAIFHDTISNPLEGLAILSEVMENSSRVGGYRKTKKKEIKAGKSERSASAQSAYTSREQTLDFNRSGRKGRQHNATRTFFNAKWEGRSRIIRAMKDDPVGTLTRGAILVTIPKLIEYFQLKDDKDYKQIPDWQKRTYYFFKAGDRLIRIPMPHSFGFAFGSAVIDFVKFVDEEDPESLKDLAKEIKNIAQADIVQFLIPTVGLPVVEAAANYDTFRNKEIVNHFNKTLPKELQFSAWTSETSKEISRLMSEVFPDDLVISPSKLDHIIYGYTSGVGRGVTTALDIGVEKVKGKQSAPSPQRPITEKMPVANVFITPNPRMSAESIQRAFEVHKKLSGLTRAIKTSGKDGASKYETRIDDLLEDVKGSSRKAKIANVKAVMKNMREVSKSINEIYQHEKMQPKVKRRKLDRLYEQMLNHAMSLEKDSEIRIKKKTSSLGKPLSPKKLGTPLR